MNIVLHEPEIPFNTGNVGRTCAATGTALHLIRPYGFFIDDKAIKRAGMDYWPLIELYEYDDFGEFTEKNPGITLYMATTKASKSYSEIIYRENDFIMFGKESGGIPLSILQKNPDDCIRIPMLHGRRSLNLSNSVAVVLYEALRQQGFSGLY